MRMKLELHLKKEAKWRYDKVLPKNPHKNDNGMPINPRKNDIIII